MKLLFVGTSSGRTSAKRYHSSILLSNNNDNVLIDTGDGIARALLSQGIKFNLITDIIISHNHSDHLAGLPSLLTQMIIEKREESLNIFTHQNLIKSLKNFLNLCYIFPEKLTFELNIIGFKFNQSISVCKNIGFKARKNSHVRNKHNINTGEFYFISSSFLFTLNSRKVLYTSDVGTEQDLALFNDQSPKIMITETTHIPYEAFEEIFTTSSINKLYLTHIENEESLNEWHSRLPENIKQKILICHDGMTLEL